MKPDGSGINKDHRLIEDYLLIEIIGKEATRCYDIPTEAVEQAAKQRST